MSADRVVLVPRWGAGCDDDWYPWLRAELARRPGGGPQVACAPLSPGPRAPRIDDSVAALAGALGPPALAARTVAVGHSVGCQVILRHLAGRPAGAPLAAALMVAGWWWSDRTWPALHAWLDAPLDAGAAAARVGRVVVLLSDDDPFAADWRSNRRLWRERLGAEVRVLPGAGHIDGPRAPAVAEALSALLAPARPAA